MKKRNTFILFSFALCFLISSCKAGDCGCPKFEAEAATQPLLKEKR